MGILFLSGKYSHLLYIINRSILRVFHSVGGAWEAPSHLTIFFETPPPPKPMPPMGHSPLLKNEAPPSEKQPPQSKHETPFRQMSPKNAQ